MQNEIARFHALERTSPKGERFIGTCWQCGRSGLTLDDTFSRCENIAQLTEGESLIMAIKGPDKENDNEK